MGFIMKRYKSAEMNYGLKDAEKVHLMACNSLPALIKGSAFQFHSPLMSINTVGKELKPT